MKPDDKLFENCPADIKRLRKMAKAELRKAARREWREKNPVKK